jgi:MFS family permease
MRRLVVLVSAIVLLDTAFYAAVSPLLPHYVEELDLSKTAAGILAGSFAAGSFVGTIPAIWLSGRVGNKRTVLLGLAGLAVTCVAFGFAREIWLLDTARFLQGVASACSWTAGFAWVVERSPAERRGEVIGTPLGAAIAGALVGPVLGALATELSPEAVFTGVAVVAAGLALPVLGEQGTPAQGIQSGRARQAIARTGIRLGVLLVAIPALASGVVNVLLPLRMDVLGATGFAIGAAYLIAAGVEAAASPILGRVSDRRGRLVPIRGGLLAAAVILVLLPLPSSALVLGVMLTAFALAGAAFWAPSMALLSDEVELAGVPQGYAFAFTNVAWSTGQLIGNAGGGSLAEATADWVSYCLVALVCVLTLVAISRGSVSAASGSSSSPPDPEPSTSR